jgi:dihydrolipoamide dehydrogenase
MIDGYLLAHKASHEGIIAAENASGLKEEMNYKALPLAVYTEPEFSSVGLTEEEAKERGIKIQVGLFSLQANGRALTTGSQEGMVKIIADEKDEIIGAHILAANASEFISEISLAMKRGLKIQDVSSSIHIHPTLSEGVMEAALKAKNQAIHILNI